MFARSFNCALRITPRAAATQNTGKNAAFCTAPVTVYDRDPAPQFFSKETQKLLQKITEPKVEKVFRKRLDGHAIRTPVYKFMTDKQLEEAKAKAEELMWERLQMPPVVKVRKDDDKILSKNPNLQGYSETKFVFTDISYGISNKNRVIVVREPTGILRPATHNERDRLNQIYFPMPGRDTRMPKMFEDEHLQPILDRFDYEFVLDKACTQFDPDHPDFHRVTQTTYDHCNKNMQHDKLRSTRHYGPMVFYLAWTRNIDNVLLENIITKRIKDAVLVIELYYRLNPNKTGIKEDNPIKIIQHFIETEAVSKRGLNQALNVYIQLEADEKQMKENIEKAHGRTSSSHKELDT